MILIMLEICAKFEIDDDNNDGMTPVCKNPVMWVIEIFSQWWFIRNSEDNTNIVKNNR